MEILFKLEKTMNALSMMEEIGSAELELRGAIVSQYLMQSDRTSGQATPAVIESQFEAELLNDLRAAALEKREREERLQEDRRKVPDRLSKDREARATLLQIAIWTSGPIALALLIVATHSLLTVDLQNAQTALGSGIHRDYTYAQKRNQTDTTSRDLELESSDKSQKLMLIPNDLVILSTGKNLLKGNLLFYDGSPSSSFFTIVDSNLMPAQIFQCRGCSIVAPSGKVFFDKQADDFKTVKEMDRLALQLAKALQKTPDLGKLESEKFTYTNQQTGHSEKLTLAPNATGSAHYAASKSGSIVLRADPASPNNFQLVGFYDKGKSLAAVRTKDGWRSTLPLAPTAKISANQKVLFVFSETDFDPVTAFLRNNLVPVLLVIVVLALLAVFAVKFAIAARQSRTRVRSTQSLLRSK